MFKAARDSSGVERRMDIDDESFRPFVVNEYVRYRGELYEIRGQRDLVPRTVLVDVTAVNGSINERLHTVVEYTSLSGVGQTGFRSVLSGNESSISYPIDEFPLPGEPMGDTGYIKYQGTYYQLELAHGHVPEYALVVSNASSSGSG